ncbi:MAG: GIY-YIG nuclease family protein [Sphingomonas sp.]|uniref:GIY-YIG nuclease family protein n=1 Tax=Sphingomonas sp. TaxID=28214 RepID=UPI0025F32821|nr:GIY-YIG nuclease family protein [Sphingomonas sp.]MBX3564451.1 GIY-YIG nuclease family protein [Sphingomonas sp.]
MREELQPCVYILASARNGTFYTGVTARLLQRVYEHRNGITKGFAWEHRALALVWYESHNDMESTILREKAIKRWKREYKLNLIERDNPEWLDLAVGLGFDPLPRD